jgi:hypothetical protein
VNCICEPWKLAIALLNDAESNDRKVHGNDAATDRLPLALSRSAWSVARVAIGEEQSHTGWVHNTLLHREALLVVAAGDLEDVALEFVADAVARHFGTHSTVHEDAELAFIFNLDQLLRSVRGEGDVELHLDGGQSREKRLLVGAEMRRRVVVGLRKLRLAKIRLLCVPR